MKIAIIDDDPGQLLILNDIIGEIKGTQTEFYDDPTKFKQMDFGQYKVIIIDHRFHDGTDWKDVYKSLKNNPQVIVTMTYPKGYYQKEFPNLYYSLTEEVNEYPNVSALQKNDESSIVRMIETEVLEERLMKNISKISL